MAYRGGVQLGAFFELIEFDEFVHCMGLFN
jgi:hypothetical protein